MGNNHSYGRGKLNAFLEIEKHFTYKKKVIEDAINNVPKNNYRSTILKEKHLKGIRHSISDSLVCIRNKIKAQIKLNNKKSTNEFYNH